jgi:hypothetical protein
MLLYGVIHLVPLQKVLKWWKKYTLSEVATNPE